MEWISELLSRLAAGVSIQNPASLSSLFLLGVVSDIGFPLAFVLETFIFFTSYEIGPLSSQTLLTILMLLLGRELGAFVLYSITRAIGHPFIRWLAKYFPLLPERMEQLRGRFRRSTILGVAVVRLIPGLLQVPSLAAGTMGIRYACFALGVALSSLIYDFILVFLGLTAWFALPHLDTGPKTFLIAGFISLIIIVWLILFLAFRRRFIHP